MHDNIIDAYDAAVQAHFGANADQEHRRAIDFLVLGMLAGNWGSVDRFFDPDEIRRALIDEGRWHGSRS